MVKVQHCRIWSNLRKHKQNVLCRPGCNTQAFLMCQNRLPVNLFPGNPKSSDLQKKQPGDKQPGASLKKTRFRIISSVTLPSTKSILLSLGTFHLNEEERSSKTMTILAFNSKKPLYQITPYSTGTTGN